MVMMMMRSGSASPERPDREQLEERADAAVVDAREEHGDGQRQARAT